MTRKPKTKSVVAANDNQPESTTSSECQPTAARLHAEPLTSGKNILGFFELLDQWSEAANDNDPKPDAGSKEDNTRER
jgi:hypothetical protein